MFRLPIDLMDRAEREDYLDAKFEAARDRYEFADSVVTHLQRIEGAIGPGWVSECCDAPWQAIEYPWCPKCHNNTGYYRAYCPECGDTLEHFGGLDAMPEGLVCAVCNDAIYSMADGAVIARLE